jgi:hypothetical protein
VGALNAVEALEIPADLATALAAYSSAQAHFDAFPRSAKRGILEWIAATKVPATRAKRVAETAWPRTTPEPISGGARRTGVGGQGSGAASAE